MKVFDKLSSDQLKQLHRLYQQAWWTRDRSLDQTRRCVRGSQLCVGLVDDNQTLQAFARVITDFCIKALILDVMVAPEHRGSGLGKRLMQLVKDHPDLVRVRHLELYCLPELMDFYRQSGFTENLDGIQLMRLSRHQP